MSRRSLAILAFILGGVTTPGLFVGLQVAGPLITKPALAEDEILIDDTGLLIDDTDLRPIRNNNGQNGLIVVQPMDDDESPQSVYLNLAKKKMLLLTQEELTRETQILQMELSELEATRKLGAIERQLNELIEQYPSSTAAKGAQMMLQARNPKLIPNSRLEETHPDEFPNDRFAKPRGVRTDHSLPRFDPNSAQPTPIRKRIQVDEEEQR